MTCAPPESGANALVRLCPFIKASFSPVGSYTISVELVGLVEHIDPLPCSTMRPRAS